MTEFQSTEEKAVQELISWKKGVRPDFPMNEVKAHFKLFEGGSTAKEHKAIATKTICIKCLAKLQKSEVQDIEQQLKEIINAPKKRRDFGMSM